MIADAGDDAATGNDPAGHGGASDRRRASGGAAGAGSGVPEVYAAPGPRTASGSSQERRAEPRLEGPSLWWGPDPGTPRALLRATTRAERRLSLVCAAALAGVFGLVTVVVNRERLALAVAGAAVIVLASVVALVATWWRRVDVPDEPRFHQLERSRRRALRRDLLAGRPGDPRDRAYARFWVGRRLRYPANSAWQLGLTGWLLGLQAQAVGPLSWWGVLPLAVLVLHGAVPLALRPRWLRLADRLDHEPAP